jgi:cytochrome P450
MAETVITYNPFEPGFVEDPYSRYAAMREGDPIHRSELEFWVLFRYDDILRLLRDPTLSVEDRNARPTALDEMVQQLIGERAERGGQSMLSRDPPDHTRLRKLVSKAFTTRVIQDLRPRIQSLVDGMLDAAHTRGEMDVIADFAFPLPFVVISEMLGVPASDGTQLREWSGLIVRSLEPLVDPDTIRAIADASDHMFDHVSELIAWQRKEPTGGLLAALIAAEEHGDVLSDEELVEQVTLLYIAGHETTVNLIGNGVLALLRNRDELRRLQGDAALMPGAIEELLRFDSPVQMTRRITLADVEIGGKTIEKGAFCALVLASANHDPARFGEDSERLDVSREAAHQHLSFGGGAHYCLGAALARLEGEVAIGSLIRRFPNLELADEPAWNGRLNLRGLDRFPVALAGVIPG